MELQSLSCHEEASSARSREQADVTFFGHALEPGDLSTSLIAERLFDVGREWPARKPYLPFRWLSFPFVPPAGAGRKVTVEFQVFPVTADIFWRETLSGSLYPRLAQFVAQHVAEHPARCTVGWGAFTKHATKHGARFLADHENLASRFASTHGDAGTVALVLLALVRAGVGPRNRVAVIGASGAIGKAVARLVGRLSPRLVVLVGRPDTNGSTQNRERLAELGKIIAVPAVVEQDKSTACLVHETDVVVVATAGTMRLFPSEVPSGAQVLDVTTPPACLPADGWDESMVVRAGCARFTDPTTLPEDFGELNGRLLHDVGAGGDHVLWGCAAESMVRAATGWQGHVVGQEIDLLEVEWCLENFQRMGIGPQ